MLPVAAPEPPSATLVGRLDALGGITLASIARWGGPKLLHGLRLWCAVSLALYIAFQLELGSAYWAGVSAVVVCQPDLGASLRKSSYRFLGTIAGAVFALALAACFPQSRPGFMIGLAIWGGTCAFVATALRDYASYGAALAGYTAAIVGSGALGATGGIGSDIFTVAILRASETCVGIVSAGLVIAATSVGSARRILQVEFCHLTNEVIGGLAGAFLKTGEAQAESRPRRHTLVSRTIAISPMVENALGEEYDLQHSLPVLRAATAGLVTILSGWRTVANCLEHVAADEGSREGAIVRQMLPEEFRSSTAILDPTAPHAHSPILRQTAYRTARALMRLPAETPSLRLIADGAAEALLGLIHVLDGIALLNNPLHIATRHRSAGRYIPDLLPAALSAVRTIATIGFVEVLWLATSWPSGTSALSFAALSVILFSPRGDRAYGAAKDFMLTGSCGVVLALAVQFVILPYCTTTESIGMALGLVLVPTGMLMTLPNVGPAFAATGLFFIRVLQPENQMSYDAAPIWNLALAITVGLIVATAAMSLFPPPSPEARAHRAVSAALRDFRRLLLGRATTRVVEWEHRSYRRLADLPPPVDTLLLARCVATLSIGTAVLRLRRIANQFQFRIELEQALHSLGHGQREETIERLTQLDRQLSNTSAITERSAAMLRAHGNIRMIREALILHADHFDLMGAA